MLILISESVFKVSEFMIYLGNPGLVRFLGVVANTAFEIG